MDKIKVSKVIRTHGLRKWIWPFQSWSQFTSFVFFEAVGGLIVIFILKLDADVPMWVLFSALLGGFPALYAALPGRLEIKRTDVDVNAVITLLKNFLWFGRYVEYDTSNSEYRFQNKLPAWLLWKENEVLIRYSEGSVLIEGPVSILNKIEKKLNVEDQ